MRIKKERIEDVAQPDGKYELGDALIKWTFNSKVPLNLTRNPTSIIEKSIEIPSDSKKWLVQIISTIEHENSTFFISIDGIVESLSWGAGTGNGWSVTTFIENKILAKGKYVISLKGHCDQSPNNRVALAQLDIIAYKKKAIALEKPIKKASIKKLNID